MRKRVTAVALSAVLMVLIFASCGKEVIVAADVSGAQVTKGVYTYFYGLAAAKAQKESVEKEKYEQYISDTAHQYIREYVAVNSIADSLGVSLDYSLKTQAAQNTENIWSLFYKHYEKVGVSKTDLHKIKENEALKTALLLYYYDSDSKQEPVSEKKLKSEFEKKYIGVKIIASTLSVTDALGNTQTIDESEVSRIKENFSSMKSRLNSGADIDEVYADYNIGEDIIGTEVLETYLFTSSSAEYGKNFFKRISELEYNKADVLVYSDAVYLVYRVDITADEDGYFFTYRNDILSSLKMKKLEEKIKSQADTYQVDTVSSVVKKIQKTVLSVHEYEEITTENDK